MRLKSTMKSLLIASALLLATQANVFALDTTKLPVQVQEAANRYMHVYDKDGMAGLQKDVPDCYKTARQIKRREYNEHCIMLDMMTYFSNKAVKEEGINLPAFDIPMFNYDATDKRMRSILTESGMANISEQDEYLNVMATTAKAIMHP